MYDLETLRRMNEQAETRERRQTALPYVRGRLAALTDALAALGPSPALEALLEDARAEYREAHGHQA